MSQSTAFWLLFIYISSTIKSSMALKITASSSKMMKELNNGKSAESLFLELMTSSRKGFGEFSLLSTLLASEITPFRKQYLKFCKSFTIYTFLGILKYAGKYKKLDLTEIISADCISASRIKFINYEERLVPFFIERRSFPILSKDFKPSQWSIESFSIFVRDALAYQLKPDWSSWCGDVDLSATHFHENLWNSSDKLWRFLNYKCIQRMTTESKRIMMRGRFLSIFSPKDDSPKEALMKIVTLSAAHRALKGFGGEFPQELGIIRDNFNSLLDGIVETFKLDDKTIRIPWTAARLIQNCGIIPKQMKFAYLSPRRLLPEIYSFLSDEPSVNSSWLLNLIYLALKSPGFMTNDTAFTQLSNWFFRLDPSISNICQLLEIVNDSKPKFRVQIILQLGLDTVMLSSVYKEFPAHCKSRTVPFKTRVRTLLSIQRTFPNQALLLRIPFEQKDEFWFLFKVIIEKESTIFTHNSAVFELGFDLFAFKSLDHFFEHFLQTFLDKSGFYHFIESENDGRPVIVPSLQTPEKVIQILFSVLARSVILGFKVPFYIHVQLFKTAIKDGRYQFSKILKLKRLFHNNRLLLDNQDVADCESVNRNDRDLNVLIEHITNISKRKPSPVLVSESTIIRLIERQIHGIKSAIKNNFPTDVPLKFSEIYYLIIFNRQ